VSDTDAQFDDWFRRSAGRPGILPDLDVEEARAEGVSFPEFGGGGAWAGDGLGPRLPVSFDQPPPHEAGFKRILREEADAVRYPGGRPGWR
jgi:hypothetical protein